LVNRKKKCTFVADTKCGKIVIYISFKAMKKKVFYLGVMLLLAAVLIPSCKRKTVVTVYDGEVEWKSPASMQFMFMLPKENSDELIKYWSYFIETKVDGNDRTLAIDFKTGEPGTYSGTYDFEKQTWSTQAIDTIELRIYNDTILESLWRGESATLKLNEYKYTRKKQYVDAALDAVLVKEGSTEKRNIKVVIENRLEFYKAK